MTGTYNAYDDHTWWNVLTENQAQEVGKLRASAKAARKRKAGSLVTDDGNEESDKKILPNSGTQFGRNGTTPNGKG